MNNLKLTVLLLSAFLTANSQEVYKVSSPSGEITAEVRNIGQLSYSISMDGRMIILNSPMGFQFKNEPDMGAGLQTLNTSEREINESWIPVLKAKHARVFNHYKELFLNFREQDGLMRKMDIELRAYDDGIAFRYKLYRSEQIGNRHLTKELTEYRLASDPKAWVADYKGYVSSREQEFIPKPLSSLPDTVKAALPMLIEIDKQHYAAITEAKIKDYPGFFLSVEKGAGNEVRMSTRLSPLPLEKEDGVKVRFSDTLWTPWRLVMLANDPGRLIESETIQNLNDPCAIKDPSWIKPGISAWDNWWSGNVKMDMPTIKKYIDFAAVQGWPYMLIDWQWYGSFDTPGATITKAAPQLDMPELLAYARDRKVRLWLWLTSGDSNRNNNFEEAFALYEKWGIAGVKIDFMNRDDQEMVNWYHEIISKAARHHLMVNFHGAYKPDGITRTWPNMMTREGVLGNENNKWSVRITPEHNVTLPFTRMLAGQMDYTPGAFLNVTPAKFGDVHTNIMNTRCQELAKFVIYESPLTVFCDHPDFVLGQPGAEFVKTVPTVWDDTWVLSGYPGEHIAMAKRSGKKYFIAAMNNSIAKPLEIKLDFLPSGRYELTLWTDATDADLNPKNLKKTVSIVGANDVLKVQLAVGGGFVGELKKK